MKINELIEKLEGLKNRYGDLPVVLVDNDYMVGDIPYDIDRNCFRFYAKSEKKCKEMRFPKDKTLLYDDIEQDEFTIKHEVAFVLGI